MKAVQSAYARLILACLMVGIASGLLVVGVRTSSIAQSPQERKVEDDMPKNVPIKIKFKAEKEAKVKDLSNSDWLRDFELEVTNTSGKPIYFLEFWLVFPDVLSESGRRIGIPLRYGRMDFIHFNTIARPDDVPIPSGGEYIFKIPEDDQRGWDLSKARNHRADPKKIQIEFVQLSFGDGSGFDGDAKPYPYKKDQSSITPCREGPSQVAAEGGAPKNSFTLGAVIREALVRKTGRLSAGHFFDGYSFLGNRTPQSWQCCSGTDCSFMKDDTYSCA
ncbi:MAG: hypothetical protein DMF74_06180, partial [Acidobacteria bacterium]